MTTPDTPQVDADGNPITPAAPDPAKPPEAPPAPPEPKKDPAPAAPGAPLTAEQLKKVQEDTGFDLKQLVTLKGLTDADPAVVEIKIEKAEGRVDVEMKKQGIQDFDQYKEEVRKELALLPANLRYNPDVISKTFFQVKGMKLSKAGSRQSAPASTPGKLMTGADLSSAPADVPAGGGTEGLDDFTKFTMARFGIKDKKELEKLSSRNVDTSWEENWQPDWRRG